MNKNTLLRAVLAGFVATGAAASHAADKPLKSVGVTVGDLANPFFVAIGQGAEAESKKIGGTDVKVTVVSSKYDLNTQVAQIENFIANKVDLILVNAADPKGIAPALKKAREAGITVVAVDVGADGAAATVTSDNKAAGAAACKYLIQALNGRGSVVILNGPPVTAVLDRVDGCNSVIKGYRDIKVLSENQNAGGSRDGGMNSMADILTAYPKIDGVFAINDPTAIGAALAIKQAGRSDIRAITSVDGAPDAQQALRDKNGLFVATAAQNPYAMAAKAIDIGYALMNHQDVKQTTFLMPTPIVSKESVANYAGWVRN